MSQTITVSTAYVVADFVSGGTRLFARVDQELEILARCMRLLNAGRMDEANNLYNRHFPAKKP